MFAARQNSVARRALVFLGLLGLSGSALEAQVGLASREARVLLLATVPAGASMHPMGALREHSRQGLIRVASRTVSVAANQPFRLNVIRTGPSRSRIWVQDAAGRFQQIEAGPGVTIYRAGRSDPASGREIHYRIEEAEATSGTLRELPVRYEIVVDPTL